MLSDDMRRCLETLDIAGARRIWEHLAPHLPPIENDNAVLSALHAARTHAQSVDEPLRLYSHRWLEDRGLPSGLPDHLKPKADRLYPRVVSAVGIAVRASSPELAPAGIEIRTAMEHAVLEADADGRLNDDDFVKARMADARFKARKKLFG